MVSAVIRIVRRLRQPQYVGEHRCLPCTVLNVLIAAAASVLIAFMTARALGAIVFLCCLGVIYFRGYLVPGTPTFTARYLPDQILRWFGHHDANRNRTATGPERHAVREPPDVDVVLQRASAVRTDEASDPRVREGFWTAWRQHVRSIHSEDRVEEALVTQLDVNEGRLNLIEGSDDTTIEAWIEDRRVGQWKSEPALIVDLAAARELRDRYRGWEELRPAVRWKILHDLRASLDTCPICDSDLTTTERAVEGCCRSRSVTTTTCTSCGAPIHEDRMLE